MQTISLGILQTISGIIFGCIFMACGENIPCVLITLAFACAWQINICMTIERIKYGNFSFWFGLCCYGYSAGLTRHILENL